eukprot:TRINITY_DN22786_c0_g1_i4.p1 TRINITY_DN22786_c0_g1~~TRINITY_DN22786_c0_g1_i4.p1  ORF type:complete len:394 (+),score=132.07 TRINITY_DN22786_c0_g1_i4:128-1183(+)
MAAAEGAGLEEEVRALRRRVAELEALLHGADDPAEAPPAAACPRAGEDDGARFLYAARRGLRRAPECLAARARVLIELDLSGNGLTELPAVEMPGLRKCYLHNNRLRSLPACIVACGADLRELWVDHNELTALPDHWRAPGLSHLQIGWNRIARLPDAIGSLPRLQNFFAQDNLLAEVPPSLLHLKRLQVVALRSNRLQSLPVGMGKGLPELQRLLLGHNPLGEGPAPALASLQGARLGQLYLCACGLRTVPEAIRSMRETLRWLDLSCNSIAELPDWLAEFAALRRWDCDHNRIETFSPAVARWLSKALFVSLQGNPLRAPYDQIPALPGHQVPTAVQRSSCLQAVCPQS